MKLLLKLAFSKNVLTIINIQLKCKHDLGQHFRSSLFSITAL